MVPRAPSLPLLRAFSSTASSHASSSVAHLARQHRDIPAYPYGPARWYKQSNFGLYGGTCIQFGSTVSENFEIKNRRRWKPNVRTKRLWSDALGRFLRIRVTARALRTIDKVGGLDEYLLGEKPARVKELGMGGWLLRWRVMQTDKVRERFAQQRRQMGLGGGNELVGVDGTVMTEEQVEQEIAGIDRELESQDKAAADAPEDDIKEGVVVKGDQSEKSTTVS